jgi:hypothetical protein
MSTPGATSVPALLPRGPVVPRRLPGAALPIDSWPLPSLPKAPQLMPVCASLLRLTSTIFASSITWRSIDSCTAFRYCSTWHQLASGWP